MSTDGALFDLLESHLPRAVALREAVHREPELSGSELSTRERVLEALPASAEVTKVAESGAVARIGPSGPSIGIRGELDALPVLEATGAPYASVNEGVAHACGHDVHLGALVAVAWTLHEAGFEVPLLAVLQPREETYPSGAKDVTQSGVLGAESCRLMIGAHLQPTLPAGVVACVPGGVNASADEFEIVVHGSPGHAAYPHLTADPIPALASIVLTAQSIVSRSVDPMAAAVIGVSSISAGAAANVIPGVARATGTFRAMSSQTRSLLRSRLAEVASNVARAHGCEAEVTVVDGEPVLENDPVLASAIAAELTRRDIPLSTALRSLGSDDFSYFSAVMPSAMLFVGTGSDLPLHSPGFLPAAEDLRLTARAMLCGVLGGRELLGAAPKGDPR